MLHIVTVHHGSPHWIEIQTRYVREHIKTEHQTWTSLEGIDPSYGLHFDHVIEQKGTHPAKLNHLAIEICHQASDDDLLMFLDGDSFPIADPMPLVNRGLEHAPLVAVRRPENAGDLQPHPLFCVTTVRTWRTLPGDWCGGYLWTNADGRRVSDTGGNLLRKLELTKTPWVEVLRSNRRNLDPVFFGVYGDIVYHHGAGLRGLNRFTRYHVALAPKPRALPSVPVVRSVARHIDWRRREAWDRDTKAHLSKLSDSVWEKIQRGNSDWLAEFI